MSFILKKILGGLLGATFVISSVGSVFIEPISVFATDSVDEKQNLAPAREIIEITVGKGDGFDFNSVSDALNSIKYMPTESCPAVIYISKGFYEEPVTVDLPFVSFVNADSDNPDDVVISFDKAAEHENPEKKFGTQQSATVTVNSSAVGFSAKNITIQNSYNLNQPKLGLDGGRNQTQAVALVTMADKVVLENCKFLGRQDTLYLKGASKGKDVYGEANPARVYIKNCFIEGTVDYIFGDATAFFDKCTLNMAFYKNGGHYTAANTTLFNTGYVFNECTLTVSDSYDEFTGEEKKNVDLGRPWQGDNAYPNSGSHTAFINCVMPEYLKTEGFSTWNDNTVKRKIRYMEYGSKTPDGELIDISKIRADWMYILNDEQAQNYSAYNVLRGDDEWNPSASVNTKTPVKATGITFDKYSMSIPKGETDVVRAFVVPSNADNKNVKFYSSDETVAVVDKNGKITAVGEGKAVIYSETEDSGFKVSTDVEVLPLRTSLPKVSDIRIKYQNQNVIYPDDVISGDYIYELISDMEMDCAKVQWYAVNSDGKEILLKEGRNPSDRNYTVSYADIDSKIKFVVYPETDTNYGECGKPISVVSDIVATKGGYIPKTYLRESFSDFYKQKYSDKSSTEYPKDKSSDAIWQGENDFGESVVPSWNVVTNDENDSIGGGATTASLLKYIPKDGESPWNDIEFEARMRFNPTEGGFSGNCYYNIYTSFDEATNSYYKLKIARGSNTNSLFLYLYKKDGAFGEEVLLASDEKSLVNSVPQNSGENNPYFRVKQTIKDGKIKVDFILEGEETPKASFTALDKEPLNGGFVAFENYGKISVLLLDYVFVQEIPKNSDPYITRGEFAYMFLNSVGIVPKNNTDNDESQIVFSDVSENSYYADVLKEAYSLGIVSGDENGKFNPDSLITVEEMISLTSRALKLNKIINSESGRGEDIGKFVDSAVVSEYAKEDFAALILSGVYEPTDGKLFPLQPVNKSTAQKIINKVVNLKGKTVK